MTRSELDIQYPDLMDSCNQVSHNLWVLESENKITSIQEWPAGNYTVTIKDVPPLTEDLGQFVKRLK